MVGSKAEQPRLFQPFVDFVMDRTQPRRVTGELLNRKTKNAMYHRAADLREEVCGGYFLSKIWNSAAHSPHGYSRESRWKYELRASFSFGVGSLKREHIIKTSALSLMQRGLRYLWVPQCHCMPVKK